MKIDILETTLQGLSEEFKTRYQKGAFHAEAVYKQVFEKGSLDLISNPAFVKSGTLADTILSDLELKIPEIIFSEKSIDGALKYACKYEDGAVVESVIIPMSDYKTICVSTQVGCRMGCRFCETGRLGLMRNLSASEIVAQVYAARFFLKEDIKNIVFMGMGEPLDNFEALVRAISVLNEQKGLNFAHRRITVSTSGLVEGLERLGGLGLRRLHVAVSLNAPNDAIRSYLMPVNNHAPMQRLKRALKEYPLRPGGCFLFEYVVIPGLNDLPEHASMIADYIGDLPVRINLIPCNPSKSGEFRATTDDEIHSFSELLSAKGLFVRKRWSKGSFVSAGCGQLGASLTHQ